jgi:hypothetical protein
MSFAAGRGLVPRTIPEVTMGVCVHPMMSLDKFIAGECRS